MNTVYFIFLFTGLFLFSKSQFIEPSQKYPLAEAFQYDRDYEFVISNLTLEWTHANAVCHYAYGGWLATLETVKLKQFTVEAMSESSMDLDGLWVALKRIRGSFSWLGSSTTVPDADIRKCGNNTVSSISTTGCHRSRCRNRMDCGILVRANHTVPCFASLNCDALRGFICKRYVHGNDPSTHLGWIKVRHRLYKIFYRTFSYKDANKACIEYDIKSKLAVIETYEDAQILGRYLLVGRPSLEKVWIGARWRKHHYEFEPEVIVLSNATDFSGYPPWLRGKMSKPGGCLLLDRHLSNITLFVESKCDRLQHYMCYKLEEPDVPVNICDVGDYDWRIYYQKLNWFEATKKCVNSAPTGRLAIVERKDLKYFVHIMESSKKYLLHVWLGAYYKDGIWTWTYTNRTLPSTEADGYPPWVVNKTYVDSVEKFNLCLNIDRENAIVPIFYGTICRYAQTFICQYDKGIICHNTSTTTTTTPTTTIPTTTTPTTPTTTTPTTTTPTTTTPTTTTPTTTTTTPTTTTPTTTTPTTTTPTTTTTTPTTTTTRRPRPTRTPKPTKPTKTKPTKTTRSTTTVTTKKAPVTESPVITTSTTDWIPSTLMYHQVILTKRTTKSRKTNTSRKTKKTPKTKRHTTRPTRPRRLTRATKRRKPITKIKMRNSKRTARTKRSFRKVAAGKMLVRRAGFGIG